ncbi:MAG: rRNA methyltransferase, partial [Betaproteobacteria bacterium]|nr:rRNA methyltransferase [Betaproteobacteria bacterium]
MRLATLRQILRDHSARPEHEERILRAWTAARPLTAGPRQKPAANTLPLALRKALPALGEQLAALARVRSEHPGADGSARLLVDLADAQTVES